MKPEATLYETLEVSPHASAPVIKAAYRCLAQVNHPDKNAGTEAACDRLAQINHAYSVLSDPVQRHRYDQRLSLQAPPLDRRGSTAPPKTSTPPARTHPPVSRAFAFRPLA